MSDNPLKPRIVVEYNRLTRDVMIESEGGATHLEMVAMLSAAKAMVLEKWFGRDAGKVEPL